MQQEEPNKYVKELTQEKYKYGFTTDVHTDIIERGLNEDVVRLISEKKGEPEWLLEFRLKAYRHWLTLEMPTWAHLRIPEIDYQAISYYADPTKKKEGPTISPSREANCFTKPFMKPMIAPKPKAANMMISIIAIKLMYQCDNMLMCQYANGSMSK